MQISFSGASSVSSQPARLNEASCHVDEAHVAQNREQTPANSPHGRVRDPQPNKGPDAANSLQVSMAAGPSPGEPSDAHRPWVSARTSASGTTRNV